MLGDPVAAVVGFVLGLLLGEFYIAVTRRLDDTRSERGSKEAGRSV